MYISKVRETVQKEERAARIEAQLRLDPTNIPMEFTDGIKWNVMDDPVTVTVQDGAVTCTETYDWGSPIGASWNMVRQEGE